MLKLILGMKDNKKNVLIFYLYLEKSNNKWLYIGIGGVILLLLFILICSFCFICNKKKTVRRNRSFDSAESGLSQNSFY